MCCEALDYFMNSPVNNQNLTSVSHHVSQAERAHYMGHPGAVLVHWALRLWQVESGDGVGGSPVEVGLRVLHP